MTTAKTRLSLWHNAHALSAENTGAKGLGEYGRMTGVENSLTYSGTQYRYVLNPYDVYHN